jgi:hypothetical protein
MNSVSTATKLDRERRSHSDFSDSESVISGWTCMAALLGGDGSAAKGL